MAAGGGGQANAPGGYFAIGDFLAKVNGQGSFSRRNRYSVEITPPTGLGSTVVPADIEFQIKAISFPSRTFGTTNFRYGGKYSLELPYETTNEGVSITFQGTNNWNARNFWHDWLEYIQTTDSYNMKYYDEFKGTVKISIYDETQEEAIDPKHKVSLIDAWPKSITAIELGWESSELLDFGVDIVYKKWEIEN